MSALADTLLALRGAFQDLALGWYVFGAQAVAVRGAPRATMDVDVTVECDRRRLAELTERLARAGIVHRYPERADELLRRGAVLPMVHRSGLEVDLVLAGSGLEAVALSRATPLTIDGVVVPVAHATDLAVMKVLAGRGKDLDDLRALLVAGEVDVVEARDLLEQLESALAVSDLVPAFEAALRDTDRG